MNFRDQQDQSPEEKETGFIHERLPGKTYLSRTFPNKKTGETSDDYKQPSRYVYKVFDNPSASFEFEEAENRLIYETPAGRVQVKAMMVRDGGRVNELIVFRCPPKGDGVASKIFNLRGSEAETFVNFFKTLELFPIQGDTVNYQDKDIHELLVPSKFARKLYEQDANKFRKIIESDEFAADVVALAARKRAVEEFGKMLNDQDYFDGLVTENKNREEAVWQSFFECNPWILGASFRSQIVTSWDEERLEQVVAGSSVAGPGKRVDALMKTAGAVKSLVFIEIKKHTACLLEDVSTEYRPGCWRAAKDLAGGIAQVQGTVSRAVEGIGNRLDSASDDGFDANDFSYLFQPKSLLLIGNLSEFIKDGNDHQAKIRSFELLRGSLTNPEVVTYDELYAKAKFVVGIKEQG